LISDGHPRGARELLAAVVFVGQRDDQQPGAVAQEAAVAALGKRRLLPIEQRQAKRLERGLLATAIRALLDESGKLVDEVRVGANENALTAGSEQHAAVRVGIRHRLQLAGLSAVDAARLAVGVEAHAAAVGVLVDAGGDDTYLDVLIDAAGGPQLGDERSELARDTFLLLAHRSAVVDDEQDVELLRGQRGLHGVAALGERRPWLFGGGLAAEAAVTPGNHHPAQSDDDDSKVFGHDGSYRFSFGQKAFCPKLLSASKRHPRTLPPLNRLLP
jgi:hypothetical protein